MPATTTARRFALLNMSALLVEGKNSKTIPRRTGPDVKLRQPGSEDLVPPARPAVAAQDRVGRRAAAPLLGQYVFADSSGAVVIPDGQIDDVIEGARGVEADDDRYRREIAREKLSQTRKG